MKTASDRFSNVVSNGIHPVLKHNSFKKKGFSFSKKVDNIIHVFNIQKDKWNSKTEIKFTINIGVFINEYWLAEVVTKNEIAIPTFPRISDCIIEKRIGELKYGSDYWYSIHSSSLERRLIKETELDIQKYILPFFKDFNSEDNVIQYLKSNQEEGANEYRLFILLAELNRSAEAKVVFDRLISKSSAHNIDQLMKKGKYYKLC